MDLIKRELQLVEKIDEDYILDFSVASDTPIQMSFGLEVLTMDTVSVQLERLRTAGNVIFNHNSDDVVGKILDAYIQDGKLRVKAKFSQNSEYFPMIADGTLTSVSLGYVVTEYEERDGILYAKNWTPYEVSILSIPADITVGIGRSMEVEKVEQKITKIEIIKQEDKIMENTINYRIGSQYGLTESDILFAERSALSETQFQNLIIEKLKNKAVSTSMNDVELTEQETRSYSIANAILSHVQGSGIEAGFEMDISNEIAKRTGKSTNGFYIPSQVLMNLRDMTALGTSPNKGKDFVGTVTSNNFVDYAFAESQASKLGVQFLTGLRENLQIPKFTSAASFGFYSENGTISQVDPQTGQVALAPKRGGASFNYSNQLLKQSNPSIEGYLARHIQTAVSVGIDNAVFNGSGSNQPTGILTSVTTNIITGSSLTYAKLLEFPSKVAVANRSGANMYFITNPATSAIMKSRPMETGFPTYLVAMDNSAAGFKLFESNQIAAGTVLFGDFSMCVVGQWGGLEVLVNPYTNSRSALTEITCQALFDVGVLDEKAFSKSTNVS